jgi:hypothetical protein
VSRTILFSIGTVIFFAVAAAVFLYGLAAFRELQDRDESATKAWDAEHPNTVPVAPQ